MYDRNDFVVCSWLVKHTEGKIYGFFLKIFVCPVINTGKKVKKWLKKL